MSDFKVDQVFEGGDTNDVFLTDEGTVVKEFSRISTPAFTISLSYLISGAPRFFTRSERMENEREVREIELETLSFPKILQEGNGFMEFEYIEGKDLREKASRSPEDARDVGLRFAEILDETREKDVHLVDWFLENFIETDKGLYHVDPEYSDAEGSQVSDLKDILSIVLTFKLLPPENCSAALEAFREQEGVEGLKISVLGNFVTLLYAFALGSRSQKLNAVRNLKQ
ncbi:MAG: hypothetical protein ABEJ87_02030 [Candidatus Nanohalobium sp.]